MAPLFMGHLHSTGPKSGYNSSSRQDWTILKLTSVVSDDLRNKHIFGKSFILTYRSSWWSNLKNNTRFQLLGGVFTGPPNLGTLPPPLHTLKSILHISKKIFTQVSQHQCILLKSLSILCADMDTIQLAISLIFCTTEPIRYCSVFRSKTAQL